MLDGLFLLLVLSLVMAFASFFAGALPLSMSLSQAQLRLISTVGMGVLVGTSLIVIIPEGIEAIYTSGPSNHSHIRRGLADVVYGHAVDIHVPRHVREHTQETDWAFKEPVATDAFGALPGPVIPASIASVPKSDDHSPTIAVAASEDATPPITQPPADTHGDRDPPTFFIGFSLITGFILMFLIDKLPRYASEQLSSPPPTRHISLNNLSQGLMGPNGSAGDSESESFLQSLTPSPKQSRSLATTTGLVIHAAADGIAMGASASTSSTKLGFIIFLAIMVHKAPAAFGLTSVLLKQGLSKRAARGHLIIFSLAAPVGAIGTFFLVHLLGGGGMEGESGQWWTGILLLFSGGTFLYVAMHAMQEDGSNNEHSHSSSSNGYADALPQTRKQPKPQMRDTFAAVAGMLLPLLTQFGHHH